MSNCDWVTSQRLFWHMQCSVCSNNWANIHTTVSKATGRHLDFGLLLTSITVASGFYKQTNTLNSAAAFLQKIRGSCPNTWYKQILKKTPPFDQYLLSFLRHITARKVNMHWNDRSRSLPIWPIKSSGIASYYWYIGTNLIHGKKCAISR